jgi:tetratricopeptide (TPR) repeat protein
MKGKLLLSTSFGLVLLAIIFIGIVYYFYWIKPYALPEINDKLSLEEYGLVFVDEESAVETLKHGEYQGRVPSDELELYQKVVELLPGTKDDKEKSVEILKELIHMDPENMEYSNLLRLQMNSIDLTEEFINFMGEVPTTSAVRLQKALAYVDLLQNPNLGVAVLGQTSSRSIAELNEVLKDNPNFWLAHYARALNNLYWPAGLQRTESAIKDLSYCLAITQLFEDKVKLELWPLTYEAYGDALVKEGKSKEGIAVWKDGYSKYPDVESLELRANANVDDAYEIVRKVRGIEIFQRPNPDITDLSILWKK